jgi:Phage integrase family
MLAHPAVAGLWVSQAVLDHLFREVCGSPGIVCGEGFGLSGRKHHDLIGAHFLYERSQLLPVMHAEIAQAKEPLQFDRPMALIASADLEAVLQQLHHLGMARRLLASFRGGRVWRRGEELVFGRTVDQAFYASTVDSRVKRAWATANDHKQEAAEAEGREPDLLRPITLHECRHTFASLLIDSGANPKAIQNFMGHSKMQTTFDVYGHLQPR